MIVHKDNIIKIYAGGKSDPFAPSHYYEKDFHSIKTFVGARHITFIRQIHCVSGIVAGTHSELLVQEGDFIVTDQPGHAIGVLTADCLPIVLVDYNVRVVCVIHAGWRSSVGGIVMRAVQSMKDRGCKPHELTAYFLPSAHVCCYEVSADFGKHIPRYKGDVFFEDNGGFVYDNVMFNYLSLRDAGVRNIVKSKQCTICDTNFHSYRRDRDAAGRQATVVMLC